MRGGEATSLKQRTSAILTCGILMLLLHSKFSAQICLSNYNYKKGVLEMKRIVL
jgi:hypothetical protein